MSIFNGIFNDNGKERQVEFYFDIEKNPKKISIENKIFDCQVKKINDETIIVGKEENSLFHCILPCFFQPNFFVITDKNC